MQYRTSRALALILATAGACLAASGAQAQSTGRYMTWANRPASTTPGDVAAAQTLARNDMIPRRVAPSQGPARPMMQAPTSTVAVSRGLTPASAWIGPRVAPPFSPGSPDPYAYTVTAVDPQAYAPPPVQYAPAQPAPVQQAPVQQAAADPMAPRRDAPVFNIPSPAPAPVQQSARPQAQVQAPTPMPTPQPTVQSAQTTDPSDPMAPRRDARIFQVQGEIQGQQQAALAEPGQASPSVQAGSVQAGQSMARYYSVHRDAGRRPDPTTLPEPVYFDSVSMDLAEPPPVETYVRDAQGRRRVVATEDPSLP